MSGPRCSRSTGTCSISDAARTRSANVVWCGPVEQEFGLRHQGVGVGARRVQDPAVGGDRARPVVHRRATASQPERRRGERRVGAGDDLVPARRRRRVAGGLLGERRARASGRARRAGSCRPARTPARAARRRHRRGQPARGTRSCATPMGRRDSTSSSTATALVEAVAVDQRTGQPQVGLHRPAALRCRAAGSPRRDRASDTINAAAGSSGLTSGVGSVRQSGSVERAPHRRREAGARRPPGGVDPPAATISRNTPSSWAPISSALWNRSSGSAAVARSSNA